MFLIDTYIRSSVCLKMTGPAEFETLLIFFSNFFNIYLRQNMQYLDDNTEVS